MIELILTCYLYAGQSMKPQGFDVVEIVGESYGSSITVTPGTTTTFRWEGGTFPGYMAVAKAILKKKVNPGDKVEPPNGCSIEVK